MQQILGSSHTMKCGLNVTGAQSTVFGKTNITEYRGEVD